MTVVRRADDDRHEVETRSARIESSVSGCELVSRGDQASDSSRGETRERNKGSAELYNTAFQGGRQRAMNSRRVSLKPLDHPGSDT